jgi:hypothetical protein
MPTHRTRRGVALAFLALAPIARGTAQRGPFTVGSTLLSAGVLVGGDNIDGVGIGMAMERGVHAFTPTVRLGLGGAAGIVRDDNRGRFGAFDLTQVHAHFISNVHFAVRSAPRMDLYAGASLGLTRTSVDGSPSGGPWRGGDDTDLGLGIQGGVRFALNRRSLLMAQLGLGDVPLFFAGMSFRL